MGYTILYTCISYTGIQNRRRPQGFFSTQILSKSIKLSHIFCKIQKTYSRRAFGPNKGRFSCIYFDKIYTFFAKTVKICSVVWTVDDHIIQFLNTNTNGPDLIFCTINLLYRNQLIKASMPTTMLWRKRSRRGTIAGVGSMIVMRGEWPINEWVRICQFRFLFGWWAEAMVEWLTCNKARSHGA